MKMITAYIVERYYNHPKIKTTPLLRTLLAMSEYLSSNPKFSVPLISDHVSLGLSLGPSCSVPNWT